MPGITPARRVAFEILLLVERGGFASELLLARGGTLSPADAALARELVFGVLRRQPQLDFLLRAHLPRPVSRLDPEVRIALRMGAFQSHFLARIPTHALVSESVSLVRLARKSSASGMVNAILRKVAQDPLPTQWPDPATALCQPEWLLARWQETFGIERTRLLAEAFLQKPEVYVQITPPDSPDSHPTCELEPTDLPGCYRVVNGNPARAGLRQMDIGSQWVASLIHAGPEDPVLDLCAAPGNKTAVIASRAPIAAACDLHLSRLRAMPAPLPPRVQLDATQPLPFRRRFPWILLDAPCSGTGTIARNPEIRWRLHPDRLAAFPPLQKSLLRNALQVLAPGGTIVYSTCSLEPEENEYIVQDICHDYRVEFFRRVPGEAAGDGFFAAVIRDPRA